MNKHRITDVNIVDNAVLPAPEYLCRQVLRNEDQADFVIQSRKQISDIISGNDHRILMISGPCSIHDIASGRKYAENLSALSKIIEDRIVLVMRVYFEKPRTTVGWKGLIMDPHLDGSNDIPEGLKLARSFLRDVIDLRLPTATELLDPITPQYISDLICWSAIGARTAESQTHRQMASGLSMPLGIKNGTSGDIRSAVNAIEAAMQPQTFLGVSQQGLASAVTTRGNKNCHIVLRGGESGPNYTSEKINAIEKILVEHNLAPRVLVDCSHGNSAKDHTKQSAVFESILNQIASGRNTIFGLMLESNLVAGSQSVSGSKENLVYGQSITDSCIDWKTTETLILKAYQSIGPRFIGTTK